MEAASIYLFLKIGAAICGLIFWTVVIVYHLHNYIVKQISDYDRAQEKLRQERKNAYTIEMQTYIKEVEKFTTQLLNMKEKDDESTDAINDMKIEYTKLKSDLEHLTKTFEGTQKP